MAIINGPKYAGPFILDLSDVQDDLVDVPEGGLRGARGEQEGMDKVLEELAKAIPAHGDTANVSPQAYKRVLAATDSLGRLRAKEIQLAKALEVCRESRAKKENDREDDIALIAQAAQKAAETAKNPGIAAPFEQTIRYNSQIADKAAQTKKKNAEAKAEEAKEAAGGATTPKAV